MMRPVVSVAVFALLLAVVSAVEPAAKKGVSIAEPTPAKKDVPDAKQAVAKETAAAPAEEGETAAANEGELLPRIYRRIIPADVLRDFPQHCFASTLCKLFEPDQDWSLDPFCGQSHCHLDEKLGRLFEIVLDCGPKPLNPEACKVLKPANDTGAFPTCCDVYDPETCKFPDLGGPKDRIKLRTNKAKADASSEGSTSSGSAASGAGQSEPSTSSGAAAAAAQPEEAPTTTTTEAPARPVARARGRGRPRVEPAPAASQEEAPVADKKAA